MMNKPVTLLAVDDIPDNLFVLDSILGDISEYHLDCVSSGQEALEYIAATPPDLILLDIMMPGMDGYEVTRHIRQSKKLPYIPILLVTAHDQSSLAEGLDSGADDFIRKPLNVDELMARVRSLIRFKQSLDEQTQMVHQRDDFVARLTHDLRTPLVAANRVLHLCMEGVFGEPPDEMEEALRNVISNNENLLNMINTLLQVYRHEAGQKKMARAPLSMADLVREVVRELGPLADEKGLQLILDIQPEERSAAGQSAGASSHSGYQTEGDPIELRRLLTNLLGNAIKYTDTGRVAVQLSVTAEVPAGMLAARAIQVAIEDTGVGIDPEAQSKIFEWFYQVDRMRSGSGLGLHLSKRIAEMHQGTLSLESEIGKGSTFTLSLPKIACRANHPMPVAQFD